MAGEEIRHGQPKVTRNERLGFDKYRWPAGPDWPLGLELTIYDDGSVKVGSWHSVVEVTDVSNFGRGKSNASAHVKARFRHSPEHD